MSRPRRSEHIRQALIEAGIEQLSLHGYHGTGIKQILDEVNVAKGSFYNFFASKEAFVAELIAYYTTDLISQLDDFIEGEGATLSEVEKLQHIYRFSLNKYAHQEFKKSCLVGTMAAEIAAQHPLCRDELTKSMKLWLAFFENIFSKAQSHGQVRADLSARQLASVYWAAWEGALIKMKMTANIKPALDIMDVLLGTLFIENKSSQATHTR